MVERSEVASTISLAPHRAQGLPGSAFSKPQASQVRMGAGSADAIRNAAPGNGYEPEW